MKGSLLSKHQGNDSKITNKGLDINYLTII